MTINKKNILWILVMLFIVPAFSNAASFPNKNIFIDTDDIFAGDTVTIFTIIENNTGEKTEEVISFMDGDNLIATTTVTIRSSDRTKIIKQKWKTTEGNHSIKAVIKNSKNSIVSKSDVQTFFIDIDTDGDGIGNKADNDDDNDSIPDKDDDEPLVPYRPSILDSLKKKLKVKQDAAKQNNTSRSTPEVLGVSTTTESVFTETLKPVLGTVSSLEDFRKNTSDKIANYQAKQRAIKKLIAKKEQKHKLTEDDKDELRQSQIASVFSAVGGFIFHHQTIYWIHVLILFASILHIFWGRIKKRFNVRKYDRY